MPAAHISALIDSVKVVSSWAKVEADGRGGWGGVNCLSAPEVDTHDRWSRNPPGLPSEDQCSHPLSAARRKGNGHKEEGHSIHPFGEDLMQSIPTEWNDEAAAEALRRLRAVILCEEAEERNNPCCDPGREQQPRWLLSFSLNETFQLSLRGHRWSEWEDQLPKNVSWSFVRGDTRYLTWYCNTYQVTVTKTFRRILIGPRTEEVVHTFTAPGHVFVSDPRSHTPTHTKNSTTRNSGGSIEQYTCTPSRSLAVLWLARVSGALSERGGIVCWQLKVASDPSQNCGFRYSLFWASAQEVPACVSVSEQMGSFWNVKWNVQPFKRLHITRESRTFKTLPGPSVGVVSRTGINLPDKTPPRWKVNKDIRAGAGLKWSLMRFNLDDSITVCSTVSINHEFHSGRQLHMNFIPMHNLIFPNSCCG